MTERELLDIKANIEKAKAKVSELNGKRQYMMDALRTEYDCKTVAQAQDKAEELAKDAAGTQKKIDKKMADIEERYNAVYCRDVAQSSGAAKGARPSDRR
jgi:predicted transcriptional regulator